MLSGSITDSNVARKQPLPVALVGREAGLVHPRLLLVLVLLAPLLGLAQKEDWKKPTPLPRAFRSMTNEEREEAYKQNPEYGVLVCRCEQVTEAEIRAAIRRPVGARSIDGVKRRTRAGMGRCQGGFCSPRVMEILCEELGVSPLEITKCGGDSKLLVGTLHQIAKEARPDEE